MGIMRKSDNTLHFFINGVNVGKRIKTIPPVLYGVVDLFGQAEEVTITGGERAVIFSVLDSLYPQSVVAYNLLHFSRKYVFFIVYSLSYYFCEASL